jgi:TetR/AcrR family transcriptional regulator
MPVSLEPVGARARSRLATRRRLISSARGLFADRGLHGVTSHDIARGAGVAAGTFYLHFKDKETVFREIVYEAVDRLRDRLQRAMAGAPNGKAAIRAHAEALVSFAEENRELVGIVFGRDTGNTRLEADVLDYMAKSGAELLEQRRASGTVRKSLDARVAAQAFVGMFTRVVVWWIEDPTRAPREAVIDTLVDIQLGGTLPPA